LLSFAPTPAPLSLSSLFPSTSLFRSPRRAALRLPWLRQRHRRVPESRQPRARRRDRLPVALFARRLPRDWKTVTSASSRLTRLRSEEHTSELQSRGQLVCRLLLEKKK